MRFRYKCHADTSKYLEFFFSRLKPFVRLVNGTMNTERASRDAYIYIYIYMLLEIYTYYVIQLGSNARKEREGNRDMRTLQIDQRALKGISIMCDRYSSERLLR
jgi:hypothetical protein